MMSKKAVGKLNTKSRKIAFYALLCVLAVVILFTAVGGWGRLRTFTGRSEKISNDATNNAQPETIRTVVPNRSNAVTQETMKRLSSSEIAEQAAASMKRYKELSACQQRRSHIALADYYSYSPDEAAEVRARRLADMRELTKITEESLADLEHTDASCRDISDREIALRGDLLRVAAVQGDTQAMVCYASTTIDVGPNYLSEEWFNYAARWKTEAPSFALRAFELGEPAAIPLLIDALMPRSDEVMRAYQLSEIVEPNPKSAYTLAIINERLSAPDGHQAAESLLRSIGDRLSLEDRASASAKADEMWPKFAMSAGSYRTSPPCSNYLGQ